MADHPSGIVTFLFTDIEGSTRLWETHPTEMESAFKCQETILRTTMEAHGGYVYKMIGDAFQVAFETVLPALMAALDSQRALNAQEWGETPIRVRMALHSGVTDERGDDYVGPTLNRVARLLSAGWGGQVLLTQAAADLVIDSLPPGCELKFMGEHHLKDLIRPERVYQLEAEGLPANFPPLKSLDTFPNNLPLQMNSFIGREIELHELSDLLLLKKARLVTLTGSGGTGKTRLSIQAAANLLDEYPDGAWLVELAPLTDPALVPQAVSSTLDLRESPGKSILSTLVDFLRSRRLLLVLDNCEHLVEACARMADSLLRACPGLQILASSREILGLPGEVAFRVPSLSAPNVHHLPSLAELSKYDAVRLFVERAQAASPGFTLTAENVGAVAQVVARLDGIPLAIELAAARVRMLSAGQIATRLNDAFRLLTGGARTVLPRHQTLRALVDWSYNLLTPPERTLLRRLSVFAGGWSVEAAETICSTPAQANNGPAEDAGADVLAQENIINLLGDLVNKSLVITGNGIDGEARSRMLETIRQYAHEKLVDSDEAAAVRVRHMEFFFNLIKTAEPHLRGPNQLVWLDLLDTELDNIRLALEWALQADPSGVLRAASDLIWFWHIRAQWAEGVEWLEKGLQEHNVAEPADTQPNALRARALGTAGYLITMMNNNKRALPMLQESLAIYRRCGAEERRGMAYVLNWLAVCLFIPKDARPYLDESIAIFKEIGDRFGLSECLEMTPESETSLESQEQRLNELLRLKSELGDIDGMAYAHYLLGNLHFMSHRYDETLEDFKHSLVLFQKIKNKRYISILLNTHATVAWFQGRPEEAIQIINDVIAICKDNGDQVQEALSRLTRADIELTIGRVEEAALDIADADQIGRENEIKVLIGAVRGMQGKIAWIQGERTLAHAKTEEAYRIAKEIGDEGNASNCLITSGYMSLDWGDMQAAGSLFRDSLEILNRYPNAFGLVFPLNGLACLAALQDKAQRAARLRGAVDAIFPFLYNTCDISTRRLMDQALTHIHAALTEADYQRLYADGQKLTREQTVQYALEEE